VERETHSWRGLKERVREREKYGFGGQQG